jgi:hypothetical protein
MLYQLATHIYFILNVPTFRHENINACWLSIRSTTSIISTISYLRLTYNQTTLCSRLSRCCFYWYITPRVIVIYHVIISLPIYVLRWYWTLFINKKILYMCCILWMRWDNNANASKYYSVSIFSIPLYRGRRRYMCSSFHIFWHFRQHSPSILWVGMRKIELSANQ